MKSLFSNFNARLLLIHFIAFWFFMYGFQMISFLHDYDFLFFQHTLRINFHGRFDYDMVIIEQSGSFGLIAAYITSFFISSKQGWHWINSALVFMVTFLLENFVLLHLVKFHDIYLSPGGLFHVYSKWGHLALGIALLAVGVLLIISKKVIKYINGKSSNDKKKAATGKQPRRVR
jgi:hypothetical protein